ncbi:MAG: sigma-E processing peptidase SpoIIGA [Clostridia bacterium]|nr:sigma-E processing peptidase SpoIIGA [Clostridia bacterium]
MGQTVYVDLLFLINFSMDFLCFFLCAKLLGRKLSLGRALLASALGGIYANAALFMSLGRILSLLIDIIFCAVMCAVAFYKRGKARSLPLYILVYFAISMALGGFMTAIFNLLNRADLPLEQGSSDGISVWMFALLAALSALITLFGGRFFRKKAGQKNAEIEISYRGKSVRLRGMSDSGNLLREPISGKPCIIADIGALEPIIPRKITIAARKKNVSALGDMMREDAKNIRIVPIKTAGGEGALLAVRADKITLDCGKGAEQVDALVVLSDIAESADGNEALIPSELLI